jgi:small-conductance mechanosensitive channel
MSRLVKAWTTEQHRMVLQKTITYVGTVTVLVMVLNELGFKLTAVLGAAGIVGVAVGFASQTSLSNIISGLFLLSEKSFKVGDVIQVSTTKGIVESIDLLSVKLRTFDNQFVRLPNESLIKNDFTNITHYPIRRFDINLGVAYKEDIRKVLEILHDVIDKNRFCLDEPEPLILFTGFGDSELEILLGVWFARDDLLEVRKSLLADIKERFDAEGIEIPFPHRTLYTGAATEPFPVKVVNE